MAKVLALRELLERALFRSDNVLFGAKGNIQHDDSEKGLLKQNKKIVSKIKNNKINFLIKNCCRIKRFPLPNIRQYSTVA